MLLIALLFDFFRDDTIRFQKRLLLNLTTRQVDERALHVSAPQTVHGKVPYINLGGSKAGRKAKPPNHEYNIFIPLKVHGVDIREILHLNSSIFDPAWIVFE